MRLTYSAGVCGARRLRVLVLEPGAVQSGMNSMMGEIRRRTLGVSISSTFHSEAFARRTGVYIGPLSGGVSPSSVSIKAHLGKQTAYHPGPDQRTEKPEVPLLVADAPRNHRRIHAHLIRQGNCRVDGRRKRHCARMPLGRRNQALAREGVGFAFT